MAKQPAAAPAKKRKPADPLRPPAGLDKAAAAEWRRILAAIRKEREPNAMHLAALRRYISAWQLFEKTAAAIPTASAAELDSLSQALARLDRLLRNASADLGVTTPEYRDDKLMRSLGAEPSDASNWQSWP